MFRALLRLVLVVVILAAVAAFFLGYRLGDSGLVAPASAHTPTDEVERARETGAAIGEKVATGAAEAGQSLWPKNNEHYDEYYHQLCWGDSKHISAPSFSACSQKIHRACSQKSVCVRKGGHELGCDSKCTEGKM